MSRTESVFTDIVTLMSHIKFQRECDARSEDTTHGAVVESLFLEYFQKLKQPDAPQTMELDWKDDTG